MSAAVATAVPFVDLKAQFRGIEPEVRAAIDRVLEHGGFVLGREVEAFEGAFAAFVGVEHAVGVGSGLDALRLALMALDVGRGDEVILPANTYIATALAVSALGATPVLVDCDPATYNIDPALLERAFTPRTRAVLPVHLTGQAAAMDEILMAAARHGVPVVEDAAQAHGTLYKGRPCGSLGVMGCFSFYPGKNLGAYGDGGMVTTNDGALAKRLRRLRDYGQRAKYDHVEKGLNARLDAMQAAVLGVKLPYLNGWNESRARHAQLYRSLLAGAGDVAVQGHSPASTHIYHLFIIETAQRDALQRHLTDAGVATGIHYPVPVHLQTAYTELGHQRGDFPATERLADRMLSLPMYAELQREQIEAVAGAIRAFFG